MSESKLAVIFIIGFAVGLLLAKATLPKCAFKCPKGQVLLTDGCFTPGVYYTDNRKQSVK